MSNIIEYLICFVVGFVALCSVYVNGSQQPPLPLFHRYSALSVLPKNQQKLDNTVQNVKVLIHDVKEKSGVIVDLVQHGFHELQGKVASSASFAWKNTKLVERWQAVLASVDLHQDLTMIKDEQHTLSKQKENKNYFDKENIAHWWKKQSEGRSGLLVYLVPAFSSQYQLLRTAVPFCVDRMVQYMQPLNLLILSALSKPSGINLLRAGLWASIGLGGFKMLQDTYIAGSNWLPAHAQADSYAIVTG